MVPWWVLLVHSGPSWERQNFTDLKETSTYIRKILPVHYEFLEGRKDEWLTTLWPITTSPLLNHAYLVCQHACMNDLKGIPNQIPNSYITIIIVIIIDVFKFYRKLHKTSQNCSQKIATSCDICFKCCFRHGFFLPHVMNFLWTKLALYLSCKNPNPNPNKSFIAMCSWIISCKENW